eukprot:756227-Pyramimonas_sp.AAC.1
MIEAVSCLPVAALSGPASSSSIVTFCVSRIPSSRPSSVFASCNSAASASALIAARRASAGCYPRSDAILTAVI